MAPNLLPKVRKPTSAESPGSVPVRSFMFRQPVGRPCETCRHPQRNAIDLALVGGESLRAVAERFGLSHSSVARHKLKCVPPDLAEARRQRRLEDAEFLLAQATRLDRLAEEMRLAAIQGKDLRTAVAALGERRRILTVQAGVARQSEADHGSAPDTGEGDSVIEAVVSALADFPGARQVVADKLAGLKRREPNGAVREVTKNGP